MSQPLHDKVCPLRGGQHAHERSVENLLSVPSTPTLANTTSGYSFGYVASWAVGKTDEEMRACLQVVRDAAKAMVEDLQAAMAA